MTLSMLTDVWITAMFEIYLIYIKRIVSVHPSVRPSADHCVEPSNREGSVCGGGLITPIADNAVVQARSVADKVWRWTRG